VSNTSNCVKIGAPEGKARGYKTSLWFYIDKELLTTLIFLPHQSEQDLRQRIGLEFTDTAIKTPMKDPPHSSDQQSEVIRIAMRAVLRRTPVQGVGLVSAKLFLHLAGDVQLVPLLGSVVYIFMVTKLACDHDINIVSYQSRLEALQSYQPYGKKHAESK